MIDTRSGQRWPRFALRAIAIGIAILALIDPVWSAARPPRRELVAIDMTSGLADSMVAAIRANASGWEVVTRRADGPRLPCAPGERCVVISDGSIDANIPGDLQPPASLIAIRPALGGVEGASASPNVSVRSAAAAAAHAAAAGVVTVELSRRGPVSSTDVRVLDGAAVVGTATHKWTTGELASLEVPWWPIAAGARTLRIEAVPANGETVTLDNVLDLGVPITAVPEPVLVFDARPSWASTFVRRALEDDPRFLVHYRARLAPSLSVGSGAFDPDLLESTPVVIVGGPDALSAADVALLDRYVANRGGSLILLPERRVDGPPARLIGGTWTEHLLPAPELVGPLRASEILRAQRVPIGSAVIGRSDSVPSIVSTPSGNGRVITSGAMDGWRYRHLDPGAFERFWRGLVSESAMAGQALRIDVGTSLAAAGHRVPFTVRYRTLEPHSAVEARVSAQCGAEAATAVRAWPSGPRGEFVGEVATAEPGECFIQATAGNRSATAAFAIAGRPARGVDVTLAKLERQIGWSGGVVAGAVDEPLMARMIEAAPAQSSPIVSTYPMRTGWWIVPFAGCLAIEWWLRRRHGLR
jgi:hypothetical protein